MANEKRLIDANALQFKPEPVDNIMNGVLFIRGRGVGKTVAMVSEALKCMIDNAPTVDAVEVKCKVGNLVYALWDAPVKQKYIIYYAEVKEIRIGMRNCRLTTTYRLEPIMYRGHIHEYRDDDFGKLVFLTEEEAKAALAKMDGDGNG